MYYSFHKNMIAIHILEWFLKDHVTRNTGARAAENSALHHRNKLHFKMYLENSCFKIDKCSLGEHKGH